MRGLVRNARNNDDPAALYFYREESKGRKGTAGPAEIDLIKESGGKLFPIEIKMSATPSYQMAKHFPAIGSEEMGTIISLSSRKTILSGNLLVMTISII